MGKKSSKSSVNQFDLEAALEAAESQAPDSAAFAAGIEAAEEFEDSEVRSLVEAKRDIQARLGIEEFWQAPEATAEAQALAADTGKSTLSNVKGLDVGMEMKHGRFTGNLAVRMFVERKEEESNVAQGLLKSDDVRTDVIEIGGDVVAQANPRARERPAHCGASVGYANRFNKGPTGTIGCVCISRNNNYCLLSNTHVLTDAGLNNDPSALIVQPGPADGGRKPQHAIGKTEEFTPLIPGGVSQLDAAVAITRTNLVRPDHFTFTIDPTPIAPRIGQSVVKWGRTTGFTVGIITGQEATQNVGYQRIDHSTFSSVFRNVITVHGAAGRFSDHGDSGALMVDPTNKRPVLLLFAGTNNGMVTFGLPIQHVMSGLGIQRLLGSIDF